MRVLRINKNSNILVIAPHPDDESIGAGGILLKYAKQCDVIVLTDGRQGQGDLPPARLKDIRRKEFISEMEHLSVKSYRMLGIADGTLFEHTDCLNEINIDEYDVIFVTAERDDHPDHKAAFQSVWNALNMDPDGLSARVFAYEVHTPILSPTHFIDITDCIDKKIELVRFHESQIKDLPYDQLVEECARYRATLFRMPGKRIEVFEEVDIRNNKADVISETELSLQKERLNGWLLKRWVRRLIDDRRIADDITEKGISEIYIYGYGELGKLLIEELANENISVRSVIDRRARQFINETVEIIELCDAKIDIPVIISVAYYNDEIEKKLRERGFSSVLSLKSLLEDK